MNSFIPRQAPAFLLVLVCLLLANTVAHAADPTLKFKKADWKAKKSELSIHLKGENVPAGTDLELLDAESGQRFLVAPLQLTDKGSFKFKEKLLLDRPPAASPPVSDPSPLAGM